MSMNEEKKSKASSLNQGSTGDNDPTDRDEKIGIMEAWRMWPKSVFCIVGNEFCERFNYYGMRAVLLLYLVHLGFTNDGATVMYHGFIVFAYFAPLLGAFLADGYLGKFNVIFLLSIVYAIGSVLLAVASYIHSGEEMPSPWLDIVGLFVIGLGTGGIKPCVAPFGADQFKRGQEGLIRPYFSFFYFAINAGSLISIILSPMLRVTRCLGSSTCYPLAFGLPACLMVLAVLLFLLGSVFGYRKIPPKENVIVEVVKVMGTSLENMSNFSIKRDHWLDHFLDNHSCKHDQRCTTEKCHKTQFVDDIKGLLRVLVMYVPIPFFWALYDQQGSRWLIQTTQMNYVVAGWTMPPALIQALNAIFILAFIPLFQGIIYPAIKWIGIEPTPLRRMVVGCFVAASAFVVAALVQFSINETLPTVVMDNHAHINFVNTLPCDLIVRCDKLPDHVNQNFTVLHNGSINGPPGGKRYIPNVPFDNYTFEVMVKQNDMASKCDKITVMDKASLMLDSDHNKMQYAVIEDGAVTQRPGSLAKDPSGEGFFTISINDYRDLSMRNMSETDNYLLMLCSKGKQETDELICNPLDLYNFASVKIDNSTRDSKYTPLLPGIWKVFEYNSTEDFKGNETSETMMMRVNDLNVTFQVIGQGGVYVLTMTNDPMNMTMIQSNLYDIVEDNKVGVLWQVPQYVVITAAEILISITGLEFSYSQASPSMKSIVQAAWLMTVAIGDCIIIVIAEVKFFDNLAYELLFFAGLMAGVGIIFMLLAIFYYEYRYYDQVIEDDDSSELNESNVEDAK